MEPADRIRELHVGDVSDQRERVRAGHDAGAERVAGGRGATRDFVEGLLEFERDGLKGFVQRWMDADVLRGRPVTVTGTDGFTKGVARGIDLEGALLVETPRGLLRFISGDVSVRANT